MRDIGVTAIRSRLDSGEPRHAAAATASIRHDAGDLVGRRRQVAEFEHVDGSRVLTGQIDFAARDHRPYVFGSPDGEFVANFKTAWESLLLVADGHDTKRVRPGARVDRTKLREIDLHSHDL